MKYKSLKKFSGPAFGNVKQGDEIIVPDGLVDQFIEAGYIEKKDQPKAGKKTESKEPEKKKK